MNYDKNYVKEQSKKKQKLVCSKKRQLKETIVSNRVSLSFPIITFLIFLGLVTYLIIYQENDGVASTIDFVIAVLSTAVLVLSFIKEGLTKSQKYIWWSGVYIILLTIGLLVSIFVGARIYNAGNIARNISFLGLVVTIF